MPIWKRLESEFRSQHQTLFRIAMACTLDAALAEDAVHDALVSVARSQTMPQNLRGYVRRSVRNSALRLATTRPVAAEPRDFFASEHLSPPATALAQQVVRWLPELNEQHREAIVLHLWGELSFREIAEHMDVPLGTVTSWYQRGISHLQRRVQSDENV